MPADATFVIVAAGRGERFGRQSKVLATVEGRPMLAWSIDAAIHSPSVADLVIVAGDHTIEDIRNLAREFPNEPGIEVVPGGETRQESVAAGVAAVGERSGIVLVHDAARPLVSPDLIERCAQAARDHAAAIAAIPVTDTLKHVTDRRIERTVSRDHLWAAQTPQAFRRAALVAAIAWARSHPASHTDEASLFEAMGQAVAIVEGSPMNLKVTHPEDLALAGILLAARIAGAMA
jgi:2-C-methyl-D-erythritol 4-phosphate cytidylyltransferase